jgi:hypothetical protein
MATGPSGDNSGSHTYSPGFSFSPGLRKWLAGLVAQRGRHRPRIVVAAIPCSNCRLDIIFKFSSLLRFYFVGILILYGKFELFDLG